MLAAAHTLSCAPSSLESESCYGRDRQIFIAREEFVTRYPVTPDGRYFVVRGRLWRRSDPSLSEEQRQTLVSQLMQARRAVRTAQQQDDAEGLKQARQAVHRAKVALGERGPVWWDDGAPDYNRYMVHNTPYRQWYESLERPEANAAPETHTE